jgi:predicted ester cyclase
VAHFVAEGSRDLDAIVATVTDTVEYHVKSPHYPDDPVPFGVTASAQGVRQLWDDLYRTFSAYQILIDDVLTWPERNQVLALVTITATPAGDFQGLPAGRPFRYSVAALCDYNEDGQMTKETVYGNMAIVSWGVQRMHAFLADQATPAGD